jgi:hypothetical protein
MEEMRNAYEVLKRKRERKRPLGRSRRSWKDIKVDSEERGSTGGDWIKLGRDMNQWPAREHNTEPWVP